MYTLEFVTATPYEVALNAKYILKYKKIKIKIKNK